MSFITYYSTALKAELIKLKGTGTYYICIAMGALVPLVSTLVRLFNPDSPNIPVYLPYNIYEKTIGSHLNPFLIFLFPLLIIIIAAKITQIDHRNGGWQLMDTMPLSRLSIYLSKLTVLLVGNIIAIIPFILFEIAGTWLIFKTNPIQGAVDTQLPLLYLGQLTVRIFVASLFLSIIQLIISVLFRSFILPILIGFFALLGTLILKSLNIYRPWNPFSILEKTAFNPKGSDVNHFLLFTENISIIAFVTFGIIGFIFFKNKTLRRTLFNPKNLSAVSASLLVGVLGIWYLTTPNFTSPADRTVLAGKIDSDQALNKALLIEPYLNDTIAIFDIHDNTFHHVLTQDIPLDSYLLAFQGEGQFFFNITFSTHDSLYVDLTYKNNQNRVNLISGSRLAENQYQAENSYTGRYTSYLVNNNEYLNVPNTVVDELYKEWEKDDKATDQFRTKDNYAPRPEFVTRNKKIMTVQYLNLWNEYTNASKVINPDILRNTPKKIQELKDQITLDDNSLISNEKYLTYVMSEITKNDTSDTDIRTKEINAIRNLPEGSFKDQLMFSMLKNALSNTNEHTERAELVQNYAPEIKQKRMQSLLYSYYDRIEKMAKGQPAADFIAQDLNGKNIRLSDYKGKMVVVDIWATWCGPCLQESPYFEKYAIKYKNNPNIVFVALSIDKNKDSWYVKAKSKTESVVQLHLSKEEEPNFTKNYNMESIPRFMLIDKNGNFIDANMLRPSLTQFKLFINEQLKK